jgi:hypothetical protein
MKDEFYTPKNIFDALGLDFDLDPCSPITGAVVPAKQCYSLPINGLEMPWFGLVWVNPPYSNPREWVEKWFNHKNGLLLVPTSKAKWRIPLWESSETFICSIRPPKFIRPNGKTEAISWPLDLWAIGDTAVIALQQSGLGRVR